MNKIKNISQGYRILLVTALSILTLYFGFLGLSKAQGFLAPFVTAIILSLVAFPLCQKLENWGAGRGLASFLCTLLLLIISIGFMFLLSFQVRSFVNDWPIIKDTMQPKIEQVKSYAFEHTPLTKEDLNSTQEGAGIPFISASSAGRRALAFFSGVLNFTGTFLLTFIYIFFMLNYRRRFKDFILKLFSDEKQAEVKEIISKSVKIAPMYLGGKLLLMAGLAVVYSIGLGISGVNNYILVSVIAALFTLIPYIGNIIGLAMAMAFGYLTSGETNILIGIAITFTVAQLLENYVLQPFVIGDKVNLHPLFVIVVVIIGNMVWGVIGMILAIPIMAIFTVIFLHIPVLHPYGFLFSKEPSSYRK